MPKCKVCGRELKSPASILKCIGPGCAKKLILEKRKEKREIS